MNRQHAHKPSPWRWYAGLLVEVLAFLAVVIAVVFVMSVA